MNIKTFQVVVRVWLPYEGREFGLLVKTTARRGGGPVSGVPRELPGPRGQLRLSVFLLRRR